MTDYISREALKAAFEEDGHLSAYIEEMNDAIPAADVRPVVRGKWENAGSDVWKCSVCGYEILPWNAGENFCPNCGADMREES